MKSSIINAISVSRDFSCGKQVVHALKNICIDIPSGALVVLKGRSGSGKTTLMNLLGALDKPSKGKIFFGNKEITNISERKRDKLRRTEMSFIFQSVGLISTMSAYENIDFGLRIAGVKDNLRDDRIQKYLEFVGLTKRMSHYPHEMSGGEQQRVAIARAIATEPKIMFADEPTSELDTKMSLHIVNLFKNLVKHEELTILMTTHDPSMMELADYVFELKDGEIVNG